MCGIVAYVGKKNALPVLLRGLKALEYRGYDSAGIALHRSDAVFFDKCAGRISALEKRLVTNDKLYTVPARCGIAHTRWATHGAPTDANAHPHSDCTKTFFVVHNGIIENHQDLRELLARKGHMFVSETDTETIVHLLEEQTKERKNRTLERTLLSVLPLLRGTYAIAVMSRHEPEKIVVARHFSPLLIGVGRREYIAASDATVVLPYTSRVIYLEDGDVAVLSPKSINILNVKNARPVIRKPHTLTWDVEEAKKGGFSHFMLKEIFDIPAAMENAMRGRNIAEKGLVKFGGLDAIKSHIKTLKKLYVVGCGTAHYAGMVGEYWVENLAKLDTETDIASEFRYRNPPLEPKTHAVLAISQSGETADTLAAIELAKIHNIPTLGIVNVVGSTVARKTDAGIYQYAGPEISVASTKAFSSQLTILAMLAVWLAQLRRKLTLKESKTILQELATLPQKAESLIKSSADDMPRIVPIFAKYENFLFLGRNYNTPIAFEGALKLKEITYVHAEGYGAGEMKHGPLAMIDKRFATVAIAPHDSVYEKMISNLEEIKARGGPMLAITTEGDRKIVKIADEVIFVPKTLELLTPILTVIPLQLFAYFMGIARGLDVDKPRNLAKSVTVE